MLKNIPRLSISARYIKIGVLKSIMWNVIDPSNVSKLTYLIDEVLPILKVKFPDSSIVLLSCIEVSYYCNAFS